MHFKNFPAGYSEKPWPVWRHAPFYSRTGCYAGRQNEGDTGEAPPTDPWQVKIWNWPHGHRIKRSVADPVHTKIFSTSHAFIRTAWTPDVLFWGYHQRVSAGGKITG